MDIHRLLDNARASIGKYCSDECHAYCCRKGYLLLTEEELAFLLEKVDDKVSGVKKVGDNYSYFLGMAGCPLLVDFRCSAHGDPRRSQTCRDFPVFIEGDVISFSPRCPAVRAGLFYGYIHLFKKEGFDVKY